MIDVLFPHGTALPHDWTDQVRTLIDEVMRANENKEAGLRELQYAIMRASELYKVDEVAGLRAYHSAVTEYRRYVTSTEARAIPLSDTLFYFYDYGDDWKISITCEEVFYTKDGWDYPNKAGFALVQVTDKQVFNATEAYDQANNPITGILRNQIAKVITSRRPVCIEADGLELMDDVGGIQGFCNFLLSIHEGTDEEKSEMKEWAYQQGWSGRKTKPDNIL